MTDTRVPNPNPCLEMAHVLFVDIVAYSTLHMDRQQHLLHQLQEAVRYTSAFNRAQFEDQLIRLPTGDGMALVFFRDPEAPVRCALELTKALQGVPDIKLRMGIHTGPVYRVADINTNRNVAGGGINVAQRVMDCGEAGHILLSATEAEVLHQISAWCPMLHDLGEVEVKHGVRIHLYNLYSEEAGSPQLPKKIAAQRVAASRAASDAKKKKLWPLRIASIAALLVVSLGSWFFYAHNAQALSDTDTVVLADFNNKTDDAVFDDTLRQGLAVQLEQSPFLSLISENRIRQTLRMMGQPPDARLTPQLAADLCQRTGSAAVLNGWIGQVGTRYSLILKAVHCASGKLLASTEAQASDKNHVLDALGKAATDIRSKLGESLKTIHDFDMPLPLATTPSLEALKAYSLAVKTAEGKGDDSAAMPWFQRAIQLDPKFAMAYAALGNSYSNLSEAMAAEENIRKAYELRSQVSERERFSIESNYYEFALGDLEKAQQAYEMWAQAYPRDIGPLLNLGNIYSSRGQYEKGLAGMYEALRINPGRALTYANLVNGNLYLNKLAEAKAVGKEAQAKNLDSPDLRGYLYLLAFLERDGPGMAEQVTWAAGKPGVEDVLLDYEADTAAYFGQLGKAREFCRLAVASAEATGEKETAASYEADAAIQEALFGNADRARRRAAAALGPTIGRVEQYEAALALAIVGDAAKAKALANDWAGRFPEDTLVQFVFVPTIRAELALDRKDALNAIEVLQGAKPYELSIPGGLYPIYVRGEAYLVARQGAEAVAEFQKILAHPGLVQNQPLGPVAHLALARAYAVLDDPARARTAYQDFVTLWKDADPDIPILKQAKAEYAKLQ